MSADLPPSDVPPEEIESAPASEVEELLREHARHEQAERRLIAHRKSDHPPDTSTIGGFRASGRSRTLLRKLSKHCSSRFARRGRFRTASADTGWRSRVRLVMGNSSSTSMQLGLEVSPDAIAEIERLLANRVGRTFEEVRFLSLVEAVAILSQPGVLADRPAADVKTQAESDSPPCPLCGRPKAPEDRDRPFCRTCRTTYPRDLSESHSLNRGRPRMSYSRG